MLQWRPKSGDDDDDDDGDDDDDDEMMIMTRIHFSQTTEFCRLRRPSKARPLVPHGLLGCT